MVISTAIFKRINMSAPQRTLFYTCSTQRTAICSTNADFQMNKSSVKNSIIHLLCRMPYTRTPFGIPYPGKSAVRQLAYSYTQASMVLKRKARARETRDIHRHLEYTEHLLHTRTIQLLLFWKWLLTRPPACLPCHVCRFACSLACLLIAEARHTCNGMLYSRSIKRLNVSTTSTF